MKSIISTTYNKIKNTKNIHIPSYQRIIDPLKVQNLLIGRKIIMIKLVIIVTLVQ